MYQFVVDSRHIHKSTNEGMYNHLIDIYVVEFLKMDRVVLDRLAKPHLFIRLISINGNEGYQVILFIS